jgi:translation initiation factor IF-3
LNRPFNKNNNFRGKRDLHRINNFISASEVRVILDDGEQLGVMTKNEALILPKEED